MGVLFVPSFKKGQSVHTLVFVLLIQVTPAYFF
jgi:hypothetical protein